MRDSYLVEFCLKRVPLEAHLYHRLSLWEIEWLANESYSLMIFDTKGHPDGKPLTDANRLQTFAIGNIAEDIMKDYPSFILFRDPKNRWVILTNMWGELS